MSSAVVQLEDGAIVVEVADITVDVSVGDSPTVVVELAGSATSSIDAQLADLEARVSALEEAVS